MPHEDEQFDQLPPAIVDALREFDGPAVLPDHQRDADVLSGARQHLATTAPVEQKRRNLRLFFAGGVGSAVAAAAMIALVVFIVDPAGEQEVMQEMDAIATNPQTTAALPGDLDLSGSVDILDAYALAKQIEQGDPLNTHDFNSDGRIDQRDIDLLANQAVALNTGEQG